MLVMLMVTGREQVNGGDDTFRNGVMRHRVGISMDIRNSGKMITHSDKVSG